MSKPDDTIILSVKLASGRFETSMRFNFPAEPEEFEQQPKAWHEMVQTGFRIGAAEMNATFRKPEDRAHG